MIDLESRIKKIYHRDEGLNSALLFHLTALRISCSHLFCNARFPLSRLPFSFFFIPRFVRKRGRNRNYFSTDLCKRRERRERTPILCNGDILCKIVDYSRNDEFAEWNRVVLNFEKNFVVLSFRRKRFSSNRSVSYTGQRPDVDNRIDSMQMFHRVCIYVYLTMLYHECLWYHYKIKFFFPFLRIRTKRTFKWTFIPILQHHNDVLYRVRFEFYILEYSFIYVKRKDSKQFEMISRSHYYLTTRHVFNDVFVIVT